MRCGQYCRLRSIRPSSRDVLIGPHVWKARPGENADPARELAPQTVSPIQTCWSDWAMSPLLDEIERASNGQRKVCLNPIDSIISDAELELPINLGTAGGASFPRSSRVRGAPEPLAQ